LSELPTPLTSLDCDLRDFAFMPLDVVRLRDSDLSAVSSGDEFRCAVLLWCASWHQVPAASLPDDDVVLSQFAGYGRVIKEWLKVKEGSLRGWIKCSDGRLYHPVIAEKANEAMAGKIKYRTAKEAERQRKEKSKQKNSGGKMEISGGKDEISDGKSTDRQEPSGGNPAENALIGTVDRDSGQGQGCKSSANPPIFDDDEIPADRQRWIEFFRDECAVDVDAYSIHDRTKFFPLTAQWIKSGVSIGRMRKAISYAYANAKEGFGYLPAYVDRVLASQSRPPRENKQEALEARNQAIVDEMMRTVQ